jgi:amino acid permease
MIVVIAVLLLPTVFMKDIAQLKIISIYTFFAALLFVFFNICTCFSRGTFNEKEGVSYTFP